MGRAGSAPGQEYDIGSEVRASDGECGTVTRVVVNPVSQQLTHLVVQPHHRDTAHLVPLELVQSGGSEIRLGCTKAEFGQLDVADETHFVSPTGPVGGYAPENVRVWPLYARTSFSGPAGGAFLRGLSGAAADADAAAPVDVRAGSSDYVPLGEVEVRRGDQVHATDGFIGTVEGLIIDPGTHHVTHLLLAKGHLWGRKEVSIPLDKTSRIGEVIRVGLSKDEIGQLPPVELSSRR